MLMASIVPKELLMVYVVLWRFFVTYLSVIAGAIVMVRTLGKDAIPITPETYPGAEKKIAVSGK